MPTSWKKSPDDFHKIYIANTEAFYKAGNRQYSAELDEFMRRSAMGLWSHSVAVTDDHVAVMNQIYSRGNQPPSYMLWTLTSAVCETTDFLPPVFFWNLAEEDVKHRRENSRIFIRMFTNILLYLAATDDDVTFAEAEFITDCIDKLTLICDTTIYCYT